MKNKLRLGVLGSGQLGQMMAEETLHHGISLFCYSPDEDSPIKEIGVPITVGAYDELEKLESFLNKIQILTFEFENIPKSTLEFLISFQSNHDLKIFPNPHALIIAQDRFLEKSHFKKLDLKTPLFFHLTKNNTLVDFSFPWIIKTLRFGYDGKGQTKIESKDDYTNFLNKAFPTGEEEYLVEEKISFEKEISVILTRFQNGHIETYGSVENIHKNHILDISIYPSNIESDINERAAEIAKKLADSLNYVGTLGVEFFILGDQIYLNEFAPRPHNSGHFSQNCGSVSQFKLHVAAVSNFFQPKIKHTKPTIMKNILGNHYNDSMEKIIKLLEDDRYVLHLYGKKEIKKGRKMGHLNFRGKLEDVSPLFFEI
ncbi:MAG: 5-(carboxyamino)imidazole ribonucleotide synthase [Leptospira sp.]|nr:5-(carboxyamino)imidazole ribonucleotide synthase [Leptospira sp.]